MRYLSDAQGGMSRFTSMNSEWKDLVEKVGAGVTPRWNSNEVENTVSSWHQEQRDLSLMMSRKLGRSTELVLRNAYRRDPQKRLVDDSKALSEDKTLACKLRIPDAASDIDIKANLATKKISCSMSLDAPQDRQGEKAKVNWLVRQVKDAEPEGFYIKAIRPKKAENTQALLAEILEDPEALSSNNTEVKLTGFEIFYMKEPAPNRFSGKKVFIEELERTVPHFYEQVGQRLRVPSKSPPKMDSAPASSEDTQEESFSDEA